MKLKIIIIFIFFSRESQEFRSDVPNERVSILLRVQCDQQLHGNHRKSQ